MLIDIRNQGGLHSDMGLRPRVDLDNDNCQWRPESSPLAQLRCRRRVELTVDCGIQRTTFVGVYRQCWHCERKFKHCGARHPSPEILEARGAQIRAAQSTSTRSHAKNCHDRRRNRPRAHAPRSCRAQTASRTSPSSPRGSSGTLKSGQSRYCSCVTVRRFACG